MFDPGAIGTAIIGLDAIRREQDWSGPPAPQRTARSLGYRAAFARGLRGMADLVEPRRQAPSSHRA
jgi:hypothetical protein